MLKENQTKICKYCQKEINKKAKWCPHCGKDVRNWLNQHPALLVIIVLIAFGCSIGVILPNISDLNSNSKSNSSSTQTTSITTQNKSTQKTTPQKELLEIVDYNCYKQRDYFITEGQVKNISGSAIENVEAVVTAYTEDNKFVKSDSALIKYDPIMVGQTSPFKVMMTDNPQIKKCKVEFKEFWGGTIPTKK